MRTPSNHPGLGRLIAGMVLVILVSVFLAESYAWFERRLSGEEAPWLGALIVNGTIAFCAILVWLRRPHWGLIPAPRWHRFSLLSPGGRLMLAFAPAAAVLTLTMIMGFVSQAFGHAERSFRFTHSQWIFVLVVPVVEEWSFRVGLGYFFRRLSGSLWGGYFSAMLFSMVHSLPTWSRVLDLKIGLLPGPLFLGILCEALLLMTGRVLPAIALHMACNATVIIFTVMDGRWLKWLDFLYVGR